MKLKTDRRGFLKGAMMAGLAGATPLLANETPRKRTRAIRFAHMTDIHVQPEKHAGIGMMNALEHVHRQPDKADMIFTGGDLVMDAMGATRDRTKTQWELFGKVLRDHTDLHVEHTLGNHDCWGWGKSGSHATGTEPDYGKRWAVDLLGLSGAYRSFDRAGWHWVVLDSVYPKGEGYTAKLDDPQFEWLKSDLESVPPSRPIIVISHIPILAACPYYLGDNASSGDWKVPGAWMHLDSAKITDLFWRHKNVKVCLSGHIHLVDRVDYNGVTYFCDGAVCGSWWNGNNRQCAPGYAMINLYDDGTFERDYFEWGWKPS